MLGDGTMELGVTRAVVLAEDAARLEEVLLITVDAAVPPSEVQICTQYASPASIIGHVGGSTDGFHAMKTSTSSPNCCATVLQ